MSLVSGKYLTKVEREVIVWPAPDANGDGGNVWITQLADDGRQMGRLKDKDKHNNEIFSYHPPKGFENRPGYDHTDNYVMVDSRGEVVRNPDGEAIGIKPGQALVLNPDGSVEILSDEYSQWVFSQAHDSVESETEVPDSVEAYLANPEVGAVAETKEEKRARLTAELADLGNE